MGFSEIQAVSGGRW